MRPTIRIAVLAVTVTMAATMAAAAAPAGALTGRYVSKVFTEVDVTTDVAYGWAVNDKKQGEVLKLDVYQPKGDTAARRPAFIWAHGGSLVGGDKAGGMDREFANEFAKRGWVFLSINYRLMSQFLQPDCYNDVICATGPYLTRAIHDGQHDMQAAVRWARANAGPLRINTNEITAGGHSAGTALALRTNFAPNDPGNSGNGGYPSNVAAAMTNSGAMLEPSVVGPGEPPIVMFNTENDSDFTFPIGFVNACLATTLMLNVCEFHGYDSGGHSLSTHRPDIFQKTSEFFCRRVISGCDVTPDEAAGYVGPSGSRWATDVKCAAEPVHAATNGVEVCADGLLGPAQGRAFVSLKPSGSSGFTLDAIQVDGDSDNPLLGSSIHIPADPVILLLALLDVILDGLGSVAP